MRIYRLNAYDGDEGCMVSYHASKREAEKALAEHRRTGNIMPDLTGIEPIDFEPTKRGILKMLRLSTPDRDNG